MGMIADIGNIWGNDVGGAFGFGNAKVTKLGDNKFQWALPSGQGHTINAKDPYELANQLYNRTPVQEAWGPNAFNEWNQNKFMSALTPEAPAPSAPFTVPTHLFPTSTSVSNQSSGSSSKSGINWDLPFLKDLRPRLLGSADTAIDTAENMSGTLQDQYANLMRRGLGPEAFQGTLNQLAARGMMGSSAGADAMSATAKGISKMIADQAFNSLLAGQQAKMQIPDILSQLAQLGQESTSSSGSSSSSHSSNQNPLAPYELMASLLKA